jgi:hypothetical protein
LCVVGCVCIRLCVVVQHPTIAAEPRPAETNLYKKRRIRSPGVATELHTEVPRATPRSTQTQRTKPAQPSPDQPRPISIKTADPVTGRGNRAAHRGPQSTPRSTQTQHTKPAQPRPTQRSPISIKPAGSGHPALKTDLHTEVPKSTPRAPKPNTPNQRSRAQPSEWEKGARCLKLG